MVMIINEEIIKHRFIELSGSKNTFFSFLYSKLFNKFSVKQISPYRLFIKCNSLFSLLLYEPHISPKWLNVIGVNRERNGLWEDYHGLSEDPFILRNRG